MAQALPVESEPVAALAIAKRYMTTRASTVAAPRNEPDWK